MKNRIFIVGVMKGGTTVIHENLCKHEEITSGVTKEIHYYSLYYHYGKEWYEEQFPDNSTKYTIDASPSYFTGIRTNQIPELIKRDYPNAKIIVVLRNPVKRSISHFNHLQLINKTEALENCDVNDFFNQDFRKVLSSSTDKEWYLNQVIEGSNYFFPYQMYKNVIGENNILVLLNENLKNAPQYTMNQIFDFLDLEAIELDLFKEVRYSHNPDRLNVENETILKLESTLLPSYQKLLDLLSLELYTDKKLSLSELRSSYVCEGFNGWLFLTGGANSVIDQYFNEYSVDDDHIESIKDLNIKRYENLSKLNVKYLGLIVPNKLSIYKEHLNLDFEKNHSLVNRIGNSMGDFDFYIDLYPIFFKYRKVNKLYWKTDSHWSDTGCYFAYQIICKKIGIKPINLLQNRSFSEGDILLDLGGAVFPEKKEKTKFYNILKNAKRVYSNEIVVFKEENNIVNEVGLHVGSHVVFKNRESDNKIKIILFGDSFSEYRTHLLTGMLAETVSELHFIWNSNIDYSYVKNINPDYVICQTVERFMVKIPSDDLNIVNFANAKLEKYKDSLS